MVLVARGWSCGERLGVLGWGGWVEVLLFVGASAACDMVTAVSILK